MSAPDQTVWQWIADAALAAVTFLGGILFRGFAKRLDAVEAAHNGLVTTAHFDARMAEMTQERQNMHRENATAVSALTARIDRILDP